MKRITNWPNAIVIRPWAFKLPFQRLSYMGDVGRDRSVCIRRCDIHKEQQRRTECVTQAHTRLKWIENCSIMRAKWHYIVCESAHSYWCLPTLLARAVSQKPDIKSDKCPVADLFTALFFKSYCCSKNGMAKGKASFPTWLDFLYLGFFYETQHQSTLGTPYQYTTMRCLVYMGEWQVKNREYAISVHATTY